MITTDTTKRIQLLEDTEQIIIRSLASCRAELHALRAAREPQLPPISSPYAPYPSFTHHRAISS